MADMHYTDIQIDRSAPGSDHLAISFTVTSPSLDGREYEARVHLNPEGLHWLMVKAARNKTSRSRMGPVRVTLLSGRE